jgi:hypothetical protein
LVISILSALFVGWQTYFFKKMSDSAKEELALHEKELTFQKERYLTEREERRRKELESQPKLNIKFEVDKTPDKYRQELEQSSASNPAIRVRRKFWKACVTNSGGLAELCKVTINLLSWSSPSVRHSPQGEVELVWENGQALHPVGAKIGKEFFHVIYSDERTDKLEGDYRAFVSTYDGILYWWLPELRAQDALGRGEFELEVVATSIKDGASARKSFKVRTTNQWKELSMETISDNGTVDS